MNLLETLQQHPAGKFQPGREHLLATLERQGSASWEQWAPLRDGFATFAHTSAHIRKWIPGEASVGLIENSGLCVQFSAPDTEILGVWALAERAAKRTERPFSRLVITDAMPGELFLYDGNEEPVAHSLEVYELAVVVDAFTDKIFAKGIAEFGMQPTLISK
jgi:hypothetical protein